MNRPDSLPTSGADEQAALWAARLDGSTLSAQERSALDAWLTQDPAHRTLLSAYCQLSADLEEQLPPLVASGAIALDSPAPPKRRRGRLANVWLGATAMAAAAAVALAVWPRETAVAPQTIATPIGLRQTLRLADGSRVEMNARTQVVVENSTDSRRIRLASGEAFFSVSKDPARPFIVETPAGSVRVTGTSFNVRTEATEEIEVTVLEGSVQVRPHDASATQSAPIHLEAGGRVTASPAGTAVSTLSNSDLEDVLAWRQGQIVFDNVRLEDALARFAHYHGRSISAAPEAATLHVGGRYSLDDLDGFFGALEEVLPVRVSTDLSGAVRVARRATASPASAPVSAPSPTPAPAR